MALKVFSFLLAVALWALPTSPESPALEKLKFGSSSKVHPIFYLPGMAAESRGFWKGQGLEVEYGIVPRDKVPPLSEIYTPEFTP